MTDARFAEGPGFDWRPRTRVLFGAGTLARLGELAAPPTDSGEPPPQAPPSPPGDYPVPGQGGVPDDGTRTV